MAKKKSAQKPVRKKKTVKKLSKKPIKKIAKKIAKKMTKKMLKNSVKKKVIKKKSASKKVVGTQNTDYAQVVIPLGERIIVRLEQKEQVTAGGLIIPSTVTNSVGYSKGFVLAVGAGLKNKKGQIKHLDVKVGDSILFPSYASTKVEFNLEELHIVNESDVLGIV